MHINNAALCPECDEVFDLVIAGTCPKCMNSEYLNLGSLLKSSNNCSTFSSDISYFNSNKKEEKQHGVGKK